MEINDNLSLNSTFLLLLFLLFSIPLKRQKEKLSSQHLQEGGINNSFFQDM